MVLLRICNRCVCHSRHPLTMAQPGWISPSDLMHMREGDISAFKSETQLQYIGHLKLGIYIKTSRFVGLIR